MNKLSCGQLSALLLITDAFTLLCLMGNVSIVSAAGFLAGTLLQLLFSLPLVSFCKKGGTLKDSPKIFMWFYLIYIILWGGLLFVMLFSSSQAVTIPTQSIPFIPERLLISGLIAIVCLYASSPGIKALSRSAVIAAALGIVCIGVVIIGGIPRMKLDYLTELSHSDSFTSEVMRGFVLSGGAGCFAVLLGCTKGSAMRNTAVYYAGKSLLYTLVPITASAVAGGIMEITDFPVITAAQLSQPFSSQRVDSLFLIVFVIMAVFAVSVQTVTASYLLSELFPNFRRFRSTLVLALMIVSSFFLRGVHQYSVIYSTAVITALLIVPLIMKAVCRRERG